MDDPIVDRSDPQVLASLFGVSDTNRGWDDDDFGAILRHQLATLIDCDLRGWATGNAAAVAALDHAIGLGIRTFADLFADARAPLELLKLAKMFAKNADVAGDRLLPMPVATVIYYAAITAARLRHDAGISILPAHKLVAGLKHSMRETWLCEPLRALFSEGIVRLDCSTGEASG